MLDTGNCIVYNFHWYHMLSSLSVQIVATSHHWLVFEALIFHCHFLLSVMSKEVTQTYLLATLNLLLQVNYYFKNVQEKGPCSLSYQHWHLVFSCTLSQAFHRNGTVDYKHFYGYLKRTLSLTGHTWFEK